MSKMKNNMAPEMYVYGSETISSLGQKIWDILPTKLKNIVSYIIQKESCDWAPQNCPCRLCKTYIHNIRFL